jgi:hypothetical protein
MIQDRDDSQSKRGPAHAGTTSPGGVWPWDANRDADIRPSLANVHRLVVDFFLPHAKRWF